MKKYAGQPHLIKEINKNLISQVIKEQGPISKPDMAKATKLSLPTVNKLVDMLVRGGSVKVSGIGSSVGGRKPCLYEINGEAGHVLALFFEGDCIRGAISNLVGTIIKERKRVMNLQSAETVIASLFAMTDELLAENTDIKAIGIGVPGVVKGGAIYNIPTITGWEGIQLKAIMETRHNIPVFIENDVNLTAIGVFYRDLYDQFSNIVYMYFGKGIGSGIIINKRLYKGASNFAGEIGYMVTDDTGDLVTAKLQGLTEQKIAAAVRALGPTRVLTDTEYSRDMEHLVRKVAHVIINTACLINPEVVVVKGDFIDAKFLSMVEAYIKLYLNEKDIPRLTLLLDNDAGMIGTINLCLSGIHSHYLVVNSKGV